MSKGDIIVQAQADRFCEIIAKDNGWDKQLEDIYAKFHS